ncbi:hypothetical protein [Lentzea pudingi]|nr:hypothetical protein [Lentzea pudingi]
MSNSLLKFGWVAALLPAALLPAGKAYAAATLLPADTTRAAVTP